MLASAHVSWRSMEPGGPRFRALLSHGIEPPLPLPQTLSTPSPNLLLHLTTLLPPPPPYPPSLPFKPRGSWKNSAAKNNTKMFTYSSKNLPNVSSKQLLFKFKKDHRTTNSDACWNFYSCTSPLPLHPNLPFLLTSCEGRLRSVLYKNILP